MPTSKKRSNAKKRTGVSRSVGTSPTAISALTLAFGTWYKTHAEGLDDHPTPAAMLASFSRLNAITADLPGKRTLTHPVPDTLDALLDHFDEADEAELDDPIWEGASVVDVLDHLLDFLIETERWRGTTAELEESSEIIHELTGDEGGAASGFFTLLVESLETVEAAPVDAQIASLDRWSVIAAIPEFLAWIGAEKTLTATGALRTADIPIVEGLLGLPSQRQVPGSSMWDSQPISAWWYALAESKIIALDGTSLRAGSGFRSWGDGDAAAALDLRVAFVRHYLTWWLTKELDADTELGSEVTIRVIGQLCVALSPELLPGASVDALNLVFDDARPDHDDPDDEGLFGDDDEELSAEVHRLSNEYASERTVAVLGELAASGALTETPVPAGGIRYVVEPDRAHAFSRALQLAVGGFVDDDDNPALIE
ncbi:hypothetical protein [Agreia sp. VKM Ac-1783]|uniref:hypothetical protein n=1 Tax=Agreia sp. VKM Ac-1783 TaxID=1938889 RepID=UPI000A2AC0C2|nr:hypothetical protein [Agreia sp. VKM Ac-1783]SMQ71537.1 hypothetical protein SAMN06295943_2447 [Agreia sp. VKM Ac-1783]